jgi:hypothetical protein
MLTNCPQEQGNYIITGNYFEACLKISDNNELKWYHLSHQDIVCDGFEGQVHIEFLSDGIYSLRISDIKNKSDDAKIIIKESCAIDSSNNETGEISLPIRFVSTDSIPPTVTILKHQSKYLVQNGSDAIFYLFLQDENNMTFNLSEEYFAVDFEYKHFTIELHDARGLYKITFSDVRGTNGEKKIQILPGMAIDQYNNYSLSFQSSFFLYDDKKNIDTSPPEIILSAPKITDNTVEYFYEFHDNMEIVSYDFDKQVITTVGFSAEIEIEFWTKTIRFKNIQSTSDSNEKYIIINSGVATDSFNNRSNAVISPVFTFPE